jgi:hypothetical protein
MRLFAERFRLGDGDGLLDEFQVADQVLPVGHGFLRSTFQRASYQ